MFTETAYAKLNLALHVRRRRSDGYHELETVFAFCEDGDEVRAEPADETTLTIDGPFAEGLSTTDNLAVCAAAALGVTARLHLTKRLPVASGIGGGSADAAAVLRLLTRPPFAPPDSIRADAVQRIARALGADVPACVASISVRASGVGDVFSPGPSVTGMPVLLVNPRVAVATAAVFAGWDGIDRGPLPDVAYDCDFDYIYDCGPEAPRLRNDLLGPALAIAPVIGDVLAALYEQSDVLMTRMSGSGATCFATFADIEARDVAYAEIAAAHPEWWSMATCLR